MAVVESQLPRTILLGTSRHGEALTDTATVTPGQLVSLQSDGGYARHATEGGYAEANFAHETVLGQGTPGVAGTIDTVYAIGDLMFIRHAEKGERIFAFLKAGYNYTSGMQLISDGAGNLKPLANAATGVTVKQVVAVVLTALNLSGTGAVATRTAVRVW